MQLLCNRLHLSLNTYTTVDLPQAFLHSQLYNQISVWEELAKLSHAFPNLQVLIACNNPIRDIPLLTGEAFPALQTLNLCLSSWQSIQHLASLCRLKDLSVLEVPVGEVPVGEGVELKKRRYACSTAWGCEADQKWRE